MSSKVFKASIHRFGILHHDESSVINYVHYSMYQERENLLHKLMPRNTTPVSVNGGGKGNL